MRKLFFFMLVLMSPFLSQANALEFAYMGDSVMVDARTNAWVNGQGWPALSAARAGATKNSFAVSGAATAAIANQLTAALAISPACLLIGAGENDIGVIAPAIFKSQLDGIVTNAISGGVPAGHITLVTPFIYQNAAYLAAVPPYLQAVRDIGAARGVPVIDVFDRFSEFSLTRSDYSSLVNPDGHPTIAGHVEIANLFSLPQNAASCAYHNPPITPAAQIPPMTSATTGGLTWCGNNLGNVGGSGAPVWALSTDVIQWNQGGTGWVTVQFPSAFVPYSYSITGRPDAGGNAYFPKSRTFQGWNGSAWVDLDQVTNEAAWGLGEVRTRVVGGTAAYSLYRVNVTASQGGTYLHMRLLQIYAFQ